MPRGSQHCGPTALRVVVARSRGLSGVPELLRACSQRCVSGAAVSLLSFCNAQKFAHRKSGTPARWCHQIASAPRWLSNKGSMCLKHPQQPPQRAAHTACTLACVLMAGGILCAADCRGAISCALSGGVSLRYGWLLQGVFVSCCGVWLLSLSRYSGLAVYVGVLHPSCYMFFLRLQGLYVVPNVCLFVPLFIGATRVRAGCSYVVMQSPEAAVSPGGKTISGLARFWALVRASGACYRCLRQQGLSLALPWLLPRAFGGWMLNHFVTLVLHRRERGS